MSLKPTLCAAVFAAAMALALPASAGVATYDDQSAWSAAAGGPVTNTTEDARVDGLPIFDITLNDGVALTLSPYASVAHAGSVATGWETWAHSYTGAVYASTYDLTAELSPVSAFGFEIEPASMDSSYTITLTLDDSTVLMQSVAGDSGAKFFGWVGQGIKSFTISAAQGSNGFAFGNFFSVADTAVPEPASLSLFGAGLIGLSRLRSKRRRA
ncbi:MAG TPA: PEP-CTERM sorting domain-containing protein [Rhizomicrobium sp.]|nr:PEP-CTERM sorting domain-containing protein [Rhizomicrobium sp.]